MVKSAKESIKQQVSNIEMYEKMKDVFVDIDKSFDVSNFISL